MKHTVCFAALAALATSCNALAVGGIAEVTIIDRSTGVALTPHLYRGEYWVAGKPGATYAIEIRNHLDQRLLAVTAVDGVNVISGATAAWGQTGYVFNPGQDYRITGWRKSDSGSGGLHVHRCAEFLRGAHGSAGECWSYRGGPVSRTPAAGGLHTPCPPGCRTHPLAGWRTDYTAACHTHLTAARRRAGKRAAAGFFNTPARLPGTRGLFRGRHAIPEVSLQVGRTRHDTQTRYRPWRARVLLRNQHRVRPDADST